MAITQVGSASTDAVNNGDTLSLTKPTGVTSGDVLILCLTKNEASITASGFTLLREVTGAETGSTWSAHVYYKVCGGSEPASYSITSGDATAPFAGVLSAWRGVDNGTPINTSAESADTSSTQTASGPNVTTTSSNRRICIRGCRTASPNAVATFSSATSGWSELGEAGGTSTGSVRYSICQYGRTADDSAGSNQTTASITASQAPTDNGWFHVALQGFQQTSASAGVTTGPTTVTNKPTPGVKCLPTVIG